MRNLTKIHILNCFNDLMKEYPFEKITVEMILKKCEVSKSTFYRYYIDKFDVMNYSYVVFVERMFKFNQCNNLKDVFIRLLDNGKENSVRIKNAYAYHGMNSFTSFLHDYSCKQLSDFVEATRKEPINELEKLRISMLCYSNIYIIKDYIDNKITLPKEIIAEQLLLSLPESIQNLWY